MAHVFLVDLSAINFSIPLNTNVVGGIVTYIPLHLPGNLPFDYFFSWICARMDLEPLDAEIGYRFKGDCTQDPTFRLANDEDWRMVVGCTHEKVRRARTREVVVKLVNLVRIYFYSMLYSS